MGLTIHYSARIKSMALLPEFIHEVADICQSMGWEAGEINEIVQLKEDVTFKPPLVDNKNIQLQGIYFNPPRCESVILSFLSSGWTSAPIQLQLAKDYERIDSYPAFKKMPKLVYTIHTKTQRGGADIHIAIVKLLKYLEKKYFAEMNVSDEGNYWHTMDKTILQARFDAYTQLIDSVKGALEKDNWRITDAPFHLSDKIDDLLNSRKDDLI
jgi:hypothetical protein